MPPFEFYEHQNIVGYDMDVIRAVAKKIGIAIRIQDMDMSALIPALKSNRIDIAISSLTPNAEREEVVAFSRPYLTLPLAVISMGKKDFSNISNFAGQTIGVQMGTTHEQYALGLAEKDKTITIKSLNKLPELVEELKNKRIDGVIMEATTGLSFQNIHSKIKIFTLPDVDVSFAVAVRKEDPMLLKIDEALQSLREDGTLAKLRQKWFKNL